MKSKIKLVVASLALATAFSMPAVQAFAAPSKTGNVKVVKAKSAKKPKFHKNKKSVKSAKSKKPGKQSGKISRKSRMQARKKV